MAWTAASADTKGKAASGDTRTARGGAEKKKKREEARRIRKEKRMTASASCIQAAERGRRARLMMRQMRERAAVAQERKATYMPKMIARLPKSVAFADAHLHAPVITLQAAARRRLARKRCARRRARILSKEEEEVVKTPAAASVTRMWDAHGRPLPAWIDSLPVVAFSPAVLKELRALRKTHTTSPPTGWRPQRNGDYYVAAAEASDDQRIAHLRLLLRAWDLTVHAHTEAGLDGAAADAPPPASEADAGPPDPAAALAAFLAGAEATEGASKNGTGVPRAREKRPPDRTYSHEVELVAVLSAPTAAAPAAAPPVHKGSFRKREHVPPPVKVLRARRPQALLIEAEDRRTFREHEATAQPPFGRGGGAAGLGNGLRHGGQPPRPKTMVVPSVPGLTLNLQPVKLKDIGRSESKLW